MNLLAFACGVSIFVPVWLFLAWNEYDEVTRHIRRYGSFDGIWLVWYLWTGLSAAVLLLLTVAICLEKFHG